MSTRRGPKAIVTSGALLALVVTGAPVTAASEHPGDDTPAYAAPAGNVITHWNRIALRTIYIEAESPIPSGTLYLGFTSLAVYDAVRRAQREHPRRARLAATTAASVAAHDVLVEYFPASSDKLDAALDASLGRFEDSRAKTRSMRIGHAAAEQMIADRVGDGRPTADDPEPVTFDKRPAIGIWRPTAPGKAPMAVPWLGFVDPLVLSSPTQVKPQGPDPLRSRAYAADYRETKRMGSLTSRHRTRRETRTALFFNYNSVQQYLDGLGGMLNRRPVGLRATARLFALVNASFADGLITTWRQKYDIGFWRPITAIHQAARDGNPSTAPNRRWKPLADAPPQTGTPPYPENVSGHATITNAFTRAMSLSTGRDTTDLRLFSAITQTRRHYTSLHKLSQDAFNARIWLGLHFRAAMQDGRYVGHHVARIVDRGLP